ncbi:ferrous iron transport protein A [Chloroflexota bacterium]
MSDKKLVTLRQMGTGQSGKVVELQGGRGLINRLSAMGIRPGKKITKISSMLMRGPVTIQSGHTRLAIGFGMASKIIVELEE